MEVRLCVNEDAHKMLRCFRDNIRMWEEGSKKQKADILIRKLQYFHTSGIEPAGYNPLDICCKRFLLNIEKTLSESTRRFRLIHDNYWDTWGHIVGLLLRKHADESTNSDLVSRIKSDLLKDFQDISWSERQLIIRSFATIAKNSSGYDKYILDTIQYFYYYCDSAISASASKLDRAVQDSVEWSIMAQAFVSEKYSKGLIENVDQNDLIDQLVNMSLQSLELINGVWKYKRNWDIVHSWKKSVFQYLFPIEPFAASQAKPSENACKAFYDLFNHLRRISKDNMHGNIHDHLKDCIDNCKEIRKKYL